MLTNPSDRIGQAFKTATDVFAEVLPTIKRAIESVVAAAWALQRYRLKLHVERYRMEDNKPYLRIDGIDLSAIRQEMTNLPRLVEANTGHNPLLSSESFTYTVQYGQPGRKAPQSFRLRQRRRLALERGVVRAVRSFSFRQGLK